MKKKLAVFTAWPDLIDDLHDHFDLHIIDSMSSVLMSTFANTHLPNGLERFAVWVHDCKLYNTYQYCLYVSEPVNFDLHDLIKCLDDQHTAYLDVDGKFLFYHRKDRWLQKEIRVPTYTEQIPHKAGIIFMDCWQHIADISTWWNLPVDFDFYSTMKKILFKYQANNLVFHTGEFGGFTLATQLQEWHQQGNAVDVMDLQHFERHYKARQIYNWILVGAHWQRCTHDKPLGFYNLLDLKRLDPQLRIFSQMNCTLKFVNNDIDNPVVTVCDQQDYWNDKQDTGLIWQQNGKLPELVGPL